MAKTNFADETIGIMIEQDFNPDIVIEGSKVIYEVGKSEGFSKGFAIGFGIPTISMAVYVAIYEFIRRRNKNEEVKEEEGS